MLIGSQSRPVLGGGGRLLLTMVTVIVLTLATAEFAAAQIYGIPPSVTSIQNHLPPYMPNIRPSVTSLGPLGYGGPPAFPVYPTVPGRYGQGFGRGHGYGYRNGYGYGYGGGAYIAPYYVPMVDASYGSDSGSSGPYVYSGPPSEQTLHVVIDTPAAKSRATDDEEAYAAPPRSKEDSDADSARDARPIDPTVLIFRDGHRQEVSNYAIMGQTVYVFDAHAQKIALSDLDVSATVKANDDRGVEFHIPTAKKG